MPRHHARLSRVFFVLLIALQVLIVGGHAARATWLFSYPPNQVNVDSGRRNNVFYSGDPVGFTLSISNYGTFALQGGIRYEVRDYWGQVVAQGSAPTPTPWVFPSFTVPVTQPGWYKLYLHQGASQAPWGDSVGGTMFVILRPNANFPAMPSVALPNNSSVFDGDEVARGVTGMGPQRHPVSDASQPAEAIAQLDPSIAEDKQYYTPFDPQRSRPLLIAFPNGVGSSDPVQQAKNLAGLRQIVAHYHNDVKYWEPLNEPNNNYSGADYVTKELIPFYQTVKSVDPTCKVLGPGVVTIGPYGLNWIDGFLKAGGASYIDAFSFHAYNNVNGDLTLARESLDSLNTLLTKYGAGNIEKWQTEQGYFAACYGAYEPRLEGRWTMLQMMVYEQYGIPKEHNHLWYDVSHGFFDFPAFWENADGPYSVGSFNPAAALMRVWSEELYGTNFARAYDFGALGNKLYVGSLFGGPGKQVAAFMSSGRTDGKVTLSVTGGSSVHVVSAFGVATDLPVTAGLVTLPVPELPVYVEMAAGQTVQVMPLDYGPDLALTPGTIATASGTGVSPLDPADPNAISKVINGVLENWYWNQGPGDHPWMDNTVGFPAWVQVTLPQPVQVSHVVVYAGVPWQADGSLLDYEVQYDQNGSWVTAEHVVEPTNVVSYFTPATFTTVDSFYSDRCVFEHDFAPVTTSKIRLLVHDTTWGGGATQAVVTAGGQTGPHQITLREIEVYGDGTSPPTPATASFVGADTSTQGNWKGVYGADGYTLSQDPSPNNPTLPAYAHVALSGNSNYVWAASSANARALLKAASGSTDRLAACWYSPQYAGGSFDVDVNLTDGQVHLVSLYALDWDNRGRNEGITVQDAATGMTLDTQTLSAFSGGTYLTWAIKGHVTIHIVSPNDFAVVSALFFGQGTATPTVTGVSISPLTSTIGGTQTQQFSATVTGTGGPSQAVAWATSAGTISSAGLFTAPAATSGVQTVTITATSTADSSKSAAATVSVPAASVGGTGKIRFFPRSGCAPRMLGGRFQGSADGISYTDLFTITSIPVEGQWTEAALTTDPKAYRYLRYLSPDGGWGNVSEVEFYSGAGTGAVKLSGTPFGTPGSYNSAGATFAMVFDGDTTTCFDAPGPNGDYAGIDQGTLTSAPTVTGVSVSPSVATVAGGAAQQFSATVTGTGGPSQAVAWAASAGTISSAGLFTAPAATSGVQTVTITATSTADSSKSASATVTVPAASTGGTGGTGKVRYYPRTTCSSRMLGGRFQGSADGISYTDLFTITSIPVEGQWTEAALTTDPKAYRYLRYLSPDGGWGNVSEVEFYSGAGTGAVKLSGTPFGTPGSYNSAGATFAMVFDGDTTTCFDAPGPNGDYAGIDQGAGH